MKLSRFRKRIFFTLIAFLVLAFYHRSDLSSLPKDPQTLGEKILTTKQEEAQVTKVVDGDTFEVLLNAKKEKIRVIGINTPETVDPRKSVECFGKEASKFAKEVLSNQKVILESDPSQTDRDKYGRLLRYVWVDSAKTDFGLAMIDQGYAHEYTYDIPYHKQKEYKTAQGQAKEAKKGFWADDACLKSS